MTSCAWSCRLAEHCAYPSARTIEPVALQRFGTALYGRDMGIGDVVIRRAALEDAESVGTMHYASFVETYSSLASEDFWARASAQRSIENWERLLRSGFAASVAEVDRSVVGVAAAGEAVSRGEVQPVRDRELSNLYVLESHHGTGIGQALLGEVVPPGTAAQLWLARDNPRALRFYERNGFAPDGAENDGSGFGGIRAVRLVR